MNIDVDAEYNRKEKAFLFNPPAVVDASREIGLKKLKCPKILAFSVDDLLEDMLKAKERSKTRDK